MRVSNEPLREAFIQSGISSHEFARLLGWTIKSGPWEGRPDGVRVRRALGLQPYRNGYGYTSKGKNMAAHNAQKMANVLGLDPVDIGI